MQTYTYEKVKKYEFQNRVRKRNIGDNEKSNYQGGLYFGKEGYGIIDRGGGYTGGYG